MITYDGRTVGRSDYNNDSFARYLSNMAPKLVQETSDISYISKASAYKPPNIAEELNNYDQHEMHQPITTTKRNNSLSSTSNPPISRNAVTP